MDTEAVKLLIAGLTTAIGGTGPAIAEGMIASKAMEAMGRNPSVGDSMFTKMIVALAIVESISICLIVISFLILFAV